MTKVLNILSAAILSLGALSTLAEAQVTKDNLDQNADQSQGNYAATNLNYLGGVGSLGMMQSAWKDPAAHGRRADAAGVYQILLDTGVGFAGQSPRRNVYSD